MKKASSNMRYEDAGIYRDQLHAIINLKNDKVKYADFEDRDVMH
ncbi:MAG: hypothetical protein CM1200mP1_09930 [Candidatus Neomarinimicrobiota bacterium]|nr:MAG: hypothetical protein CM1200mP1_09930 [Candidatus Neomarinimicrobiota bacterium]